MSPYLSFKLPPKPQPHRRKGTGKFLLDRTLRLVVPCIFYSFLAPPFILFWNEMAKNPAADPAAVLASQFKMWLQPGWPSKYNLATGPVSFVIRYQHSGRKLLLVFE